MWIISVPESFDRRSLTISTPRLSGTISTEPLVSDHAGPPIYITKRLTEGQRNEYREDLVEIKSMTETLAVEIPAKRLKELDIRCIGYVILDIEQNS
jgi:hypothetical protein